MGLHGNTSECSARGWLPFIPGIYRNWMHYLVVRKGPKTSLCTAETWPLEDPHMPDAVRDFSFTTQLLLKEFLALVGLPCWVLEPLGTAWDLKPHWTYWKTLSRMSIFCTKFLTKRKLTLKLPVCQLAAHQNMHGTAGVKSDVHNQGNKHSTYLPPLGPAKSLWLLVQRIYLSLFSFTFPLIWCLIHWFWNNLLKTNLGRVALNNWPEFVSVFPRRGDGTGTQA